MSNRIGKDIDVFSRSAYRRGRNGYRKAYESRVDEIFHYFSLQSEHQSIRWLATEIGSERSVFLQ